MNFSLYIVVNEVLHSILKILSIERYMPCLSCNFLNVLETLEENETDRNDKKLFWLYLLS